MSSRPRPQRTCIACRATKDKRQLIRLVRSPAGQVELDWTGKAKGRGAYVCRQAACWEKGLPRLGQALKITLSAEELAELRTQLQTECAQI